MSGRILPVGGVKEKVLAAYRAGVKLVVFPAKNEADIFDLPDDIKKDLNIITMNEVNEIVDLVLR